MRIGVVEPVGRGGLAHYACQLARALARQGADVALVTDRSFELDRVAAPATVARPLRLWDAKPAASAVPRRHRLRRLSRGARWFWEWGRLVRWLGERRFDVVQLGDVRFAAELPFVRALRRRVPLLADVCHNVHPLAHGGAGAGTFRLPARARAAYRRVYASFDRVFVHFASNRDAFLAAWSLPAERLTAIPHGPEELFAELRDPAVGADTLRERHELPREAPVALLFGGLSPYKGVDLLLAAFARVAPLRPEARLVIAGYPLPGFDLERERRRAAELGLADRTRWVPAYIPEGEVAAWMELADVAVFPYRGGWQSGALHTALTFGVPVVATDVGATAEVLARGGGRLVPPGDAPALADALDGFLADPPAARAVGAEGRRALLAGASWERIAATMLATYEGDLASARARGGRR